MATLYDTLVSQGVQPGQTYNVQAQLYNKLGAPQGAYQGTAAQNTFILGKLGGSHYQDIIGGGSSSGGSSPAPAQAPSGGSSSGGFNIPTFDTNPQDYYDQALKMLQPSEQAQIAPIQQAQGLLPSVYQQKQQTLEQNISDVQATTAQQKKEVQDVGTATGNQIGAANMSNLGAQRAAAAARGFTESSGVETSQEANIQAGSDAKRVELATNIANKLTDLGLAETHDVNQLTQQIAALPNQQAMDALNYSSEIAKIQGQTWQQAITMGNQMLQTAADQAYKAFEVAMKEQDFQLAQERLQETISHNQAMEQLSGLRVQIMAQRAGSAQTSASALAQMRDIDLSNKQAPTVIAQEARSGTTLKDLLSKYSGVMKPTDIWGIYQDSSKWGGTTETASQLASMNISVPTGYTPSSKGGSSDSGINIGNLWGGVTGTVGGWFSGISGGF